MIAAHAIAANAVCVTDNLRHFLRVPRLTIENCAKMGYRFRSLPAASNTSTFPHNLLLQRTRASARR